jgi:hypothetical protein
MASVANRQESPSVSQTVRKSVAQVCARFLDMLFHSGETAFFEAAAGDSKSDAPKGVVGSNPMPSALLPARPSPVQAMRLLRP